MRLPADLRAALRKDPAARTRSRGCPTATDERYVEWIDEAKRPETRARRIAAAVERARAGRPAPMRPRLHGTIAAAATPLADGGTRLDDDGLRAVRRLPRRRRASTACSRSGRTARPCSSRSTSGVAASSSGSTPSAGRALVAAHCGAQTTADTVALAAHAAESGADAVAVIGPPYFKLDPAAQRAHLLAAAAACAPLPFYVYEFAATAGYAFDPAMLARLRDEADNVTGMKVSDSPWDAFERYLLDGFDIFVGPEALIHRGREAGAVGAVSALASAFPEEVAAVVREPTEEGAARAGGAAHARRVVPPARRPQAGDRLEGRARPPGRAAAAPRPRRSARSPSSRPGSTREVGARQA